MGLEMDQDAFAKKNEIKAKQNPGYIKVMEVDNKYALMPIDYIKAAVQKLLFFANFLPDHTLDQNAYFREKKNIHQTCKTCSRWLRNFGNKIRCQTP